MNFAFILHSKAATRLQSWGYRLLSGNAVVRTHANTHNATCEASPLVLHHSTFIAPVSPDSQPCIQIRRPLRVMRVVESGQSRAHVGRMMISGHMADVCAELDRLVAREAAENCGPLNMAPIAC